VIKTIIKTNGEQHVLEHWDSIKHHLPYYVKHQQLIPTQSKAQSVETSQKGGAGSLKFSKDQPRDYHGRWPTVELAAESSLDDTHRIYIENDSPKRCPNYPITREPCIAELFWLTNKLTTATPQKLTRSRSKRSADCVE
jgi:hypothetical protein